MTNASTLEPDERAQAVRLGLIAELGGGGEVRALRHLSGGASRETWSFDYVVDGDPQALVLRRDPDDDRPRHGSMPLEVSAIQAAEAEDVPVPHVVASGTAFGGEGKPFMISARIDGETLGPRIVRSPALSSARSNFAAECGRALARIHRIGSDEVEGIETTSPLDDVGGQFDTVGAKSAAIALALRCLTDSPPNSRTAVVHGDFRNGNLIVGEDGLRAVLDWELVHIGDPLGDLGWLCTPVWCFGGPLPVGGVGTYDDLIGSYAEEAGWRPDLSDVLWWKLLGSVRWAIACLRAGDAFARGERRTVDGAALARRIGENELDILETLKELGW